MNAAGFLTTLLVVLAIVAVVVSLSIGALIKTIRGILESLQRLLRR